MEAALLRARKASPRSGWQDRHPGLSHTCGSKPKCLGGKITQLRKRLGERSAPGIFWAQCITSASSGPKPIGAGPRRAGQTTKMRRNPKHSSYSNLRYVGFPGLGVGISGAGRRTGETSTSVHQLVCLTAIVLGSHFCVLGQRVDGGGSVRMPHARLLSPDTLPIAGDLKVTVTDLPNARGNRGRIRPSVRPQSISTPKSCAVRLICLCCRDSDTAWSRLGTLKSFECDARTASSSGRGWHLGMNAFPCTFPSFRPTSAFALPT